MKTPKEEEPEPPPEQEKKPKTPPELKDCMEGKDMLAWCRAENRKGYRAVLEGMISKRRFATYCGMDAIVIPVRRAASRWLWSAPHASFVPPFASRRSGHVSDHWTERRQENGAHLQSCLRHR